jgi:hypothetical protein
MVYAYIQDVPIDEQAYGRIMDGIGPEPLDGLLMHLCVRRPEGGLRYIDVWASEEQCHRAFAERIHQAVDAAFDGNRPADEPEVRPLDVVDVRGSLIPA